MQTKLRILGFVVVASLLWTFPTSAATKRAKVQKTSKSKKSKVSYIGTASWYGKKHQGRKMANGQRFDRYNLTGASWYFPLGTSIRVVNLKNGQSVVVTITDRGPNLRLHRVLDLSEAAAMHLDYVGQGLTPIFLSPVVSLETASAEFDFQLTEPAPDNAPAGSEEATLKEAL